MQSSVPKWPARALIGGIIGAACGIVWLFDGFSGKELGSAMAAGAVFYGLLAVLAGKFAHNRVYIVILCAFVGGVAGAAWAGIRSTSITTAVIVGASLGGIIAIIEFVILAGPQNGPE